MRVLLSAGFKTQNIITSIEKKFESSGDDLFIVEYIEDIDKIFAVGNYFDKAIIVEQSITHDGHDTDEQVIREKLNRFSYECDRRNRDEDIVFLTSTEDMASMIYEETLDIHNKSAIVIKRDGKYTTRLFALLITIDITAIPDDMLYHPSDEFGIVQTEEEIQNLSGLDDEFMNEDEVVHKSQVADFDKLFENTQESGRISSEFDNDQGFQFADDDENNQEFDFGPMEGFDIDNEQNNNNYDYEDNEYSGGEFDWSNPNDEIIDTDSIEEGYGPSGELPDFIDHSADENNQGYFPEDETQFGNFDMLGVENVEDSENSEDVGFMGEMNNEGGYVDNGYEGGYVDNGYVEGVQDTGYMNDEYAYTNDYNPTNNQEQPIEDIFDYSHYDKQQNNNGADVSDEVAAGLMDDQMNQWDNTNNVQPTEINQNDMFGSQNYQNPNNNDTPLQTTSNSASNISDKKLKKALEAFAARGNNICVTGCGGCGTSTVAFNLANTLANLGYSVLLVDFDTEGRSQNYISSDCYKSMEHDGANLMAAVNSGQGINTHTAVVKRGLHLLTMGIGGDAAKPEELLNEAKITRFINLAKPSHNFIIYDVPFDSAVGFLADTVYLSDNLVVVTEMSTHGIIKTMLKICNIDSQDMMDTFFSKAQLVFNKYRGFNKLLGKKVKTAKDITKIMDQTVFDLIGEDNGLYFSSMHIAGILDDDPNYELGWFERVQYSDTNKGKEIYKDLIEKIITHN